MVARKTIAQTGTEGPQGAERTRAHRGEPVIKDVVDATRGELARVGYRALRIEDVAVRAKVNKTTIYRRWPTKVELVRDTICSMFDVDLPEPDTGSLRGDLVIVARGMIEFLLSANGQVLVRMMMAEGTDKELQQIVDAARVEKSAGIELVLERARGRGELRMNLSTELIISSLLGGLHHRIFALSIEPTVIRVEEHVDVLLYGVSPQGAARASVNGV
jgi:AcrR family transcriptional regulator